MTFPAGEIAGSEVPVYFTSLTPSGIEVRYSPAPRRHYAVRQHIPYNDVPIPMLRQAFGEVFERDEDGRVVTEWVEVPSVTTVLGCLDKPAMAWWGQGVAAESVLELVRRGALSMGCDADSEFLITNEGDGSCVATKEHVVRLLTEHKLTVNNVRDRAADRGISVHDAFENWSQTGQVPYPEIYPETERGYVAGLVKFINDFKMEDPEAEVMVGSVQHGFAGRYDLRCCTPGCELVVKSFPKRQDKVELIPAGRYLLDLKSSKGVYASHQLQLEGYEGASVECGYEPTDFRAVVHVTEDGRYEFVRSRASFGDFLTVKATYDVLQKVKKG